ncbi:disintegrin and metalloproteinase domain-containing protein 8 isoform X2 [Brachyhypopomus gauderio]|uniref:disintegrin and metalloproteinase domain-containing protein 8 isoform X2 n=1 Tax=Brachyhypopomus gauderio TaxID=698409 RepID=UPI00404243A2
MQYSAITAVIVFCLCDWGCFSESVSSLSHVERYDVVRPRQLRHRSRRSITDQAQFHMDSYSQEKYPEELRYQLNFGGNNHTIHLEKNRLLLGPNYTEIYYRADGSPVSTYPSLKDHCYYHGHILGMKDSSASVGVCSGMRGFVRAEKQVYLIEPIGDNTEGDHALYKQEHLKMKWRSNGDPNITIYDKEPGVAGLFKHRDWKTMSPFHIKRYVEMFLVVDYAEYKNFGSNTDIVRRRMMEVVNHIDKLWTVEDQIRVSLSSDDTLTRFIEWRQSNLLKRVKHDNAQFVTGIDFLGDTVGLANKFAMCAGGSGGVNQDHNKSPMGLAATIAHEMGHNMGLSHDASHCTCGPSMSDTTCIMTERVGTKFPEFFSDCSLEQLGVFLENANPSCMLDRPNSDRLYGGPVCGNAFLDPGEDCDCGTAEECENPCCNPKTCKLTAGSQCAEGECCENCQIKQAGSLCRASNGECDLSEYCTGHSEKCPEDGFRMNGFPCSSADSYCYDGQCPTLLQHCQRMWGKDSRVAPDVCFYRNTFGRNDSHCGKTKDGYRACAREDRFCGTTYCTGGNTYPVTGLKASLLIGSVICNIIVERSEDSNLSLVPTGTKCGHNKVCFDHKCQDVKVFGRSEDCSSKCSGHGVCDHRKRCHCEPGWAPPYCQVKYGDLPSVGKEMLVIGVSTAAAILVLLAVAFGSWMYCKKTKVTGYRWKKNMQSYPGQLNPLFENAGTKGHVLKDRPQISQPTFIGTTTTQPCSPLTVPVLPTRPPPQPPKKPQPQSREMPEPVSSRSQRVSVPVLKPLPHTETAKQVSRPAHPPVPPVKPTVAASKQQTGGDVVKIALRPPTLPRR